MKSNPVTKNLLKNALLLCGIGNRITPVKVNPSGNIMAKDKSGIVRYNEYQGIYRPKNLPRDHPANKNLYDAVGTEFIFTAVFKDDGFWCFFAKNISDGSSAVLGAVYYNDIEFIK